jgi:DNA processing protein
MIVLVPADDHYPDQLLGLAEPPPRLYLRAPADGPRLAALVAAPVVAVVGSRNASAAAGAFAHRLARGLARAGVAVVSGLARGIDGAAHAGALEAGGRTVAVLGCGVDRDYPRVNAPLAARIAEQGAVVSEYGPGTPPAPWRFPARNRIVAALADVTVVVEAARTSGALITAGLALELGREVMVVPAAPWVEAAAGANALLRDGATPVACVEDVLVALGIDPARASGEAGLVLEGDPGRLLAAVRRGPGTPEALAARLGFAPARLARALAELELEGAVLRERDGSIVGA